MTNLDDCNGVISPEWVYDQIGTCGVADITLITGPGEPFSFSKYGSYATRSF